MIDEGIVTFCVIVAGMICGVTADNDISGGISVTGAATAAAAAVVVVVGGIHSLTGLISSTGSST